MANSSLTQPAAGRMTSRALAEILRADIDAGKLAVGDFLPSYRELAEAHDVAVNTAQAAVRLLEQSGRVRVRKGKRAEVLEPGSAAAPLTEVGQELAAVLDEFREVGARHAALEHRLGRLLDRVRQAERAQKPTS